jgi:hypothetical protein
VPSATGLARTSVVNIFVSEHSRNSEPCVGTWWEPGAVSPYPRKNTWLSRTTTRTMPVDPD